MAAKASYEMRGVSVTHLASAFLESICEQPRRVRFHGAEYVVASRGKDTLDLRLATDGYRMPPSKLGVEYPSTHLEVLEMHSADSKIYEIEPLIIRPRGKGIVCPRDKRPGCAYVDAIAKTHPAMVGPSNRMLSYTWGYAVGDVVRSLKDYCTEEGLEPATTYIWICCLCINQHRVRELTAKGKVTH